jgi:GntR family transcriptional regulator, transcriptional repressor for pyruvate dehydrogenase complex
MPNSKTTSAKKQNRTAIPGRQIRGNAPLLSRIQPAGPQRRLSDAVVSQLQEVILSGAVAPGDRLPTEIELCESLGVSRSVVRDALRTLSSMGLVEIRHGHGTVVAQLSDAAVTTTVVLLLARSGVTLGDVVEARATIETALAPKAAQRGTAADWERMRRLLVEFRASVDARDFRRAERLHRDFHLGLIHAVQMPALEIMLRPLQYLITVSSVPPDLGDVLLWEIDLHESILIALESGDPDAAREAMDEHFRYIRRPEYAEFRSTPFHAARTLEAYQELIGSETELEARP